MAETRMECQFLSGFLIEQAGALWWWMETERVFRGLQSLYSATFPITHQCPFFKFPKYLFNGKLEDKMLME